MKITPVTCCGRSNTMQRYIWSLFLLLQLSLATAKHYYDVTGERSVTYELVCPENEELRHTLPCCEPTCSNDCTTAKCPKTYVRQPTCVCKEGYVRHKGKCILLRHCPPKPPSPLTCGENEELLPSPPSCEPTCTEDCAGRPIHTRYVDQPTCVCKKGYRRHKGKCIRVDQCPSCGPYATLKASAPCCEPSCDNDCSNVLCIESFQSEEPVCVCQDGYVKHNSTCIKRELCPQTAYLAPFTYCRSGVKRKPSGRVPVPVKYVEVNTAAPCSCYQPLVNDGRPSDYYPSATYSPMSYPAMNYAMPTTTCAPPAKPATYLAQPYSPPRYQPLNYSPSQYVPGPYVPPPAFAPSVYAQPPTTTVSPPQYMPGAYVPPPPCAPSVYAQPTTTTVAPPQYMPGPYVPPPACPPSVYVQPTTTTVAPPQYMPGPYVPPPACPPSVYVQPTTTTCAPPTAPSNHYFMQPVYHYPGNYVPPPPPPPYAYTPTPVVESSTCVTMQPPYPYPAVTLKPYYQQPPSSYQDQPYYAMPALKQCSCSINATQPTASQPCACGKCSDPYSTRTYNRPPISYNVATPSTTTAAPTTTICPPCCACNQCSQQYGPSSYQKDQPYLPQPCTNEKLPIDISYISLNMTSCSESNTTEEEDVPIMPLGFLGT